MPNPDIERKEEMFYTATDEEIKQGQITDVYFARTLEIIRAKNVDKYVKAEIFLKSFRDNYEWGVLAGVEEALRLLEGLKVAVRSMREGTLFRVREPVMVIEGMYSEFCVYETALLGLLCQASGIASKAARCRVAAGDKLVVSFGARRMHPAIAPMIDKNAYIGGCDAVSVIKSAELIGLDPLGTIPHALILIYGDTVEATKAFDEVIDKKVNRVSLIDTFNDEKFEAVRVAEALGDKLFAVRLDTPSSRRGNFHELIQEVRWELDLRGYNSVKILVSGGIDEKDILELKDVVDAFGVGTSISSAPVLDFALDIVEVEGKPLAKRGKMSGEKKVLRCESCGRDWIVAIKEEREQCDCGGLLTELLECFIVDGKIISPIPEPRETREYIMEQLRKFAS